MSARKLTLLLLGTLLVLASCKRETGEVVARAYDKYLYKSDLAGLVIEGTSPEDSAIVVQNYINQWVQQMVVLEKAKRNITKTFDLELQNYKNSLITYEYESLIVAQMLDTNVADSEIEEYYSTNTETFVLRSNIVKVHYVKIDKNAPQLPKLQKLITQRSLSEKELMEVERLSAVYGEAFSFSNDYWITTSQLQSIAPVEIANEEEFIRNTKITSQTDNQYAYFVRILDHKMVNQIAPIDFVRTSIRSIILNRRKMDIIKNMQRDLLKKATEKGEIEIH